MKASLRLRIALLSTVLSGMVMVMFGAGAWWVVVSQKTAALDARIRALGTRQPGWMFRDRDFGRLAENLDFVLGSSDEAPTYFLMVEDTGGQLLHRSSPWPEGLVIKGMGDTPAGATLPVEKATPHARGDGSGGGSEGGHGRGRGGGGGGGGGQAAHFDKAAEFFTVKSDGCSWRVGRLESDEFILMIGLSAKATAEELRELRHAATIALPAALLLIGLGGWLVAASALRPLLRIAETASRVSSRGLDQRIPVMDADPEITRLVDMFNCMMDRLEAGFRQATRFSADASHELKTPLTIMRGELEQALQRADPGSPEQRALNSLLEENHRLGRIVRSLLLLSRADAGGLVTNRQGIDLSGMLRELVEDVADSAQTTGIEVVSNVVDAVRVSGDAELLRTAILNLLLNAVKHNQSGGRVSVRLLEQEEQAVIEFANTDASIAEQEREDIFERFYRGNDARNRGREGVGLGLSLAREIIMAHGGSLDLAQDRGDGMIRFVVHLRLAPEDEKFRHSAKAMPE